MRQILTLLCLSGAVLAASNLVADEQKRTPKAGWIGVFPTSVDDYLRTFKKAVVNKDKTAYRQTLEFHWLGNDVREMKTTLARDPGFKTAHSADALKKAGAKEIKIGQKDAWIFEDKGGRGAMVKIILPLGEDKALILESTDGTYPKFPTDLASQFDPEACATALDQPPRTEFAQTFDAFKAIKKGMTLAQVLDWVGNDYKVVGSGIHIIEYKLPDQSSVLIGFPTEKLIYVKHRKDGKTEDLAK